MKEPKQYMASKDRPRHGTRISTSAHQLHCHVEVTQHVGRDFWCGDDTNRLARPNGRVGALRRPDTAARRPY
ncbi:MAG: hypothetical protein WA269_13265, partial [Candidatus Udaeobacter sp.]